MWTAIGILFLTAPIALLVIFLWCLGSEIRKYNHVPPQAREKQRNDRDWRDDWRQGEEYDE